MNDEQLVTICELAKPAVRQENLYIVDAEIKGNRDPVIWLYVDSEEGDVQVESCTRISRELSFVLDAHEVMQGGYRLNISSPGLSRPLSDHRQYVKNRGRTIRVKYKNPDGYQKLEGVLKEADDEGVTVTSDQGQDTLISYSEIVEAKIIPVFSR
ncbi:MAG: ribosome maturation factor RimP [Balneolaceae bacterium]